MQSMNASLWKAGKSKLLHSQEIFLLEETGSLGKYTTASGKDIGFF